MRNPSRVSRATVRGHSGGHHLVRPRRIWGGLAAALCGAGLVSVGTALLSWGLVVAGVAVLLAGAVLALAGGVLYDAVPVISIKEELRNVIAGQPHRGTAAGEMVDNREGRRRADIAGGQTRVLLEDSHASPSPGLAPVAGWTLFLLMLVVGTSQWDWVAHSETGRITSSRDTVLVVVLGLCGIRLGIARGRHQITAAAAFLAGAGLVLAAIVGAHDGSAALVIEQVCGWFGIGAALVAWLSPWVDPEPRACRDHRSPTSPIHSSTSPSARQTRGPNT